MKRLVYTNLDVEYALAHGESWQRPKPIATLCHRWRHILRCMPGWEEANIWSATDTPLPPDAELLCWGEDHRTLAARSAHAPSPLAALEMIRHVNDKLTSRAIRAELGIEGLGASCEVRDEAQLHDAIARAGGAYPWLLKHPLGVSGRERVSGEGAIDPRALAWAKKQLARGQRLLFEPRAEIDGEYSLHADIEQSGAIVWRGWCHLLADSTSGTHRGHRVEPGDAPERVIRWRAALTPALEVIAARGYRGPISVDGWYGVLCGERVEQPLSEINARMTFGRIALEIGRWVPRGLCYAWHHPSRSEAREVRAVSLEDARDVGEFRLPESIDPGGESGTWVVVYASRQGGFSLVGGDAIDLLAKL